MLFWINVIKNVKNYIRNYLFKYYRKKILWVKFNLLFRSESKLDVEVKEEIVCVIGNVDLKVIEVGDKILFNVF